MTGHKSARQVKRKAVGEQERNRMDNSEKANIKAVEKVLGEPISPELNENMAKMRKNLIFVSVIAILLVLANLRIDPSSTFLGLKFSGLTDCVIRKCLLLITIYLGIHFLWTAWDGFMAWRLRITGTKLSFITAGTFPEEHGDYPNDPRQSTLYHWWLSEAKQIGNRGAKLSKLEGLLQNLDSYLRTKRNSGVDATHIDNACRLIGEAKKEITALNQLIELTQKTLTASRIPVSLKRFDKWFQMFLNSQSYRWLVMDILVPLGLWGYAIYLLSRTLST